MTESQEFKNTILRCIVPFSEGVSLDDLINFAKNTAGIRKAFSDTDRFYTGSIAKRTAQLILVFPVIVSSTVSVNTAILISKAIEKKCATMLSLLFKAVNFASYKNTKDLYDYISKFHTNLDISKGMLSLDDFITIADAINSAKHESNESYEDSMYSHILNEMKVMNFEAKDSLSKHSVNEFKINKSPYGYKEIYIKEEGESELIKLMNTDKANELLPTPLPVKFTILNDDGTTTESREAVIGVKAKMYPVDGLDLRTRLMNNVADSDGLFNFIKASTGEKSFWRDLVFAFDKIKNKAISVAKGSETSKLFSLLKARANANNSRFNTSNANPITTLVITQDEVESMKKNNIDITKPNVFKVLLNNFNLMGLVIVDDSIEAAKFLFDDGSDSFETLSYAALTKDNKDQGTLAKMVNIMQRGGRV